MDIQILDRFSEKDLKEFEEGGVNIGTLAYAIVAPLEEVIEETTTYSRTNRTIVSYTRTRKFKRIFSQGVVWYRMFFQGKIKGVGIVYDE